TPRTRRSTRASTGPTRPPSTSPSTPSRRSARPWAARAPVPSSPTWRTTPRSSRSCRPARSSADVVGLALRAPGGQVADAPGDVDGVVTEALVVPTDEGGAAHVLAGELLGGLVDEAAVDGV